MSDLESAVPIRAQPRSSAYQPAVNARPWLLWLSTAVVLAAFLLPRLASLDHFVNSDERKWMARSGNFYHALVRGDWPATFQKEHPGVTVTWAGTLGLLATYPGYAWEAEGTYTGERLEMETFLRDRGISELDVLVAGRRVMVLAGALALLAAYLMLARVLGLAPAFLGFLLIAFDPFHIALTRMLHVDGLETNLMFLVFAALLAYLFDGHRRRYMVVGGVAAGLAWLTKVPSLFMVPFVGLVLLVELALASWPQRRVDWVLLRRFVVDGVLWGLAGMAVFFALWPAMWVDPIGVVVGMVQHAFLQASGHGNVTYFAGELIGRFEAPGIVFYPITWLWRTTPATLLGVIFALAGWVAGARLGLTSAERRTVGYTALFAVAFAAFMDLGDKRFDRYLLPAYPPIALAAGVGWAAALRLLRGALPARWAAAAVGAIAALVVAAQAWFSLSLAPHYMAYYNPLLGGGTRAPATMMIGWGEGIDDAARWIAAQADPLSTRVASWYSNGSFTYFYPGRQVDGLEYDRMDDVSRWLDTGYFVLYIHQWQRELPDAQFLDYFRGFDPAHEIVINDIPYVQIYAGKDVPPLPWLAPGRAKRYVDWGGAIRLLGYELPNAPLAPGDSFQADFLLENIAPLDRNLNVLVRVVGEDGAELLRAEGWPWGAETSAWPLHEIWRDGHAFTLPPDAAPGLYRIELSFYDPATLDPLPAADAQTGASLPPVHVVDFITVGGNAPAPAAPLGVFGGRYQLDAAALDPAGAAQPGSALDVLLHWRSTEPARTITNEDYATFLHLVGPDGGLVAQADVAPEAAFLAPRLWQPDAAAPQRYTLALPATAPAGRYTLYAGMYDVAGRLPVTVDGEPAGDALPIAEVQVQ